MGEKCAMEDLNLHDFYMMMCNVSRKSRAVPCSLIQTLASSQLVGPDPHLSGAPVTNCLQALLMLFKITGYFSDFSFKLEARQQFALQVFRFTFFGHLYQMFLEVLCHSLFSRGPPNLQDGFY